MKLRAGFVIAWIVLGATIQAWLAVGTGFPPLAAGWLMAAYSLMVWVLANNTRPDN